MRVQGFTLYEARIRRKGGTQRTQQVAQHFHRLFTKIRPLKRNGNTSVKRVVRSK